MAVLRVDKSTDYTIMSNCHLKETTMSLKAKGLLSVILSLPDNWDYSVAGLVSLCKEEETAIKSALDELKEFGYLVVEKKLPNETGTGRIEYIYHIFEQPQQKQGVEILPVEFQGVENQGQLKTKQSITKQLNTNIIKDIVEYLNKQLGTAYRPSTKATIKCINARLNEGYTLEDFKRVIDNRIGKWKGNARMEEYLRPTTIFGEKFEQYLLDEQKRKSYNKKTPTESGKKSSGINIGVTIL